MLLPCASLSRPCHGVGRLEILTQGRNILVRSVVGPTELEMLASLGWGEDRQMHGYIPSLDSHLSLVLVARSSAIAFPGRPGLTRNRFSPFRGTPSWVPQSSASRKQILVSRSWNAESTTTRPSLRQRSPVTPPLRLRDSHFRDVRCIKLPSGSKLL